jgi:hypothetical protein
MCARLRAQRAPLFHCLIAETTMKSPPAARRVALLAMLTFASPSFAQSATASRSAATAPLSKTLTGDAKAAYDAAKLLYEHKDFAGALAKFRQAHAISSDARLLWNMASCEIQQRHYYRAQVLLKRYLSDGPQVLTAQNRDDAEASLKAIQSFVSDARITVSEPAATIAIDGEVVGTSPLDAPVPIDLGAHVVRVQKEGFLPFEATIEASGGDHASVDARLAPMPVAAAAPSPSRLLVTAGELDTVSIDGKVVGRGSFEGALPPGTHELRVTAQGKKTYLAQIELAPSAVRTVQVTLEKSSAPVWPWIVGGAVVAAGAAVGGYFIFKPGSEREPQTPGSAGTLTLR